MTHGSLFSGIGGFDLAAQWMGWENVFHCEWNEFGQKVLKHYWPNADSYSDITKTNFKKYANTIDIISGGFPCQPFSTAGKRKGTDDERYLWHEMLRAINEIKPKFVIAENVYGITNIDGGLVFESVCLDLEASGYEVQPYIIPACAKNAPHRRDRVWFVAYRNGTGLQKARSEFEATRIEQHGELDGTATNTDCWGSKTRTFGQILGQTNREKTDGYSNVECSNQWQNFPTQPPVCSRNDGIPHRLDGITFPKWRNESIKAYGNAIVPQVAFQIFKAIEQMTNPQTQ